MFKEALVHLAFCKQISSEDRASDMGGVVSAVRQLMTNGSPRHGPVVLHGAHGAGKTSILTEIYSECEAWFGKKVSHLTHNQSAHPRPTH